jgi:hypothetical protein
MAMGGDGTGDAKGDGGRDETAEVSPGEAEAIASGAGAPRGDTL